PLQTSGTYAVNRLDFSADGKRLLGTFRVEGKPSSLAWFDLETGNLAPLLPASSYFRFALSPDGKSIAFTAMPDRPDEQSGNDGSHTERWKVPGDGTRPEQRCRLRGRVHAIDWADGGKSLVVAAELGQAHDDLWKIPLDDPPRGMAKLTAAQADE